MEFTQKRMATSIRFDFGPTELRYFVRDNSGERESVVDYANLSGTTRRVFEKNIWLRNVGLLWCVIGAISVATAVSAGMLGVGSLFWLGLGIGCVAAFYLTQSRYTVFDTEAGAVFVLEDKQVETIVSEMKARRRARLLALYGDYNPANPIEQEQRRFDWLVKEQALSREEADRRIAMGGGQKTIIDASTRLLN